MRSIVVFALAWTACVQVAAGQGSTAAPTKSMSIPFDHQGTNRDITQIVDLAPGDRFTITVTNTCPSQFDYSIHQSGRQDTPQEKSRNTFEAGDRDDYAMLEPVSKGPITFEPQYGSQVEPSKPNTGGPPVSSLRGLVQKQQVLPLDSHSRKV